MRKLNVSTTMSRSSKPTPQAKKVAPPAVPEVYRHSGSSFGSTGYASSDDGGFLQPPDSPMVLSIKAEDQTDCNSSTNSCSSSSSSMLSKSPGVTFIPPNTFAFSARGEPLTHKAAVMYHQSLALQEDQGIDLTQSPGRDSPGSSSGSAGSGSRHSTASLDSGRASSYVTGTSSNRGALSSPRYSVSSCSIGSVDRMTQRNDHDLISEWLSEIHFDEYAPLFSKAGYDLPTITRMTPEDLTAIGIKKPHDREKIKQHIDALQLPDSLPNYVPGSIDEWLRLLRLDEYAQQVLAQGYQSVCDVTQLTWEDLEDIGIIKLGHQKKILLAIKRVKDIISGKVPSPGITPHGQQPPMYLSLQEVHLKQGKYQQQQQQQQPQYILNPPQLYCANSDDVFVPTNYKQQLSLWNDHHLRQQQQPERYTMTGCDEIHDFDDLLDAECTNENDVVLIKLRPPPGKTLDSIEDVQEQRVSSHYTFNRHTMMPQEAAYYAHPSMQAMMNVLPMQYSGLINQNNAWRRSYDDGDITPTNENIICTEGGGTLPRHSRSNVNRNRPVAKVVATNVISAAAAAAAAAQSPLIMNDYATLDKFKQVPATKCFSNHCSPALGSPMMGKKHPPEPPRRQCSAPAGVMGGPASVVMEQFATHFEALTLVQQQQLQQQQQQAMQAPHFAVAAAAAAAQQQQYQQYFNPHLPHNYQHYNNQPVYANFMGGQHQTTTVEVHAEKIIDSKDDYDENSTMPGDLSYDGTTSMPNSRVFVRPKIPRKSNSSIDSIDQIPFANENAGTIKQRAMSNNRQETSLTSLSSSSSSSSCSGASSKSTSSSASVTTTIAGGQAAKHMKSSTSPTTIIATSPTPVESVVVSAGGVADLVDTNVLNDIGNMLANLTDELDAMLEEEKRAGLNDSDE